MANLRRAIRRRRAAELTVDPLIDVVEEFATVVADSVGKRYNLANSRAEKHLRSYMSEQVDLINRTTRERVQKALASDDPVTEVRRVFADARDRRARVVAEHQVARSSNWAAIDAGKWVADLKRKRWASQRDGRVRHTHVDLDGQIRLWNDDFESPSGARGPGPGQFGVASEDVNCRCAALPSRAAQRRDLGDHGDPVDLYEDVRRPFVADMERAWRRVFDEQEAAVLAELS